MNFVMTGKRKDAALVAVLIGAVVAGCDGNHPADGTGSTAKLSFLFTTDPGTETHWCQYARLPKTENGSDVLLTSYQWTLSAIHHWALYRTTTNLPSDVDFDHPFDCFAPGAMQYASKTALVIGHDVDGEQSFPSATGYPLHSEEILLVLAHTINVQTTPLQVALNVDLAFADAVAAAAATPMGLLQFYDPYIVVPSQLDATAQMRCRIPQDIKVFGATTHQHTRGTGVSAYLDAPSGEQGTDPIVASLDWDHPTVVESVLPVPAGSYIRTICKYHGDDHPVVIQGQDKQDNEMCMFEGFYYPGISRENNGEAIETCIQTPMPGGIGDQFGNGSKSCIDSLACVRSCPPGDSPVMTEDGVNVGLCWQSCMVDSCPTASAPLDAVLYCALQKCASNCMGGADCDACVFTNCNAEYNACQAHHC